MKNWNLYILFLVLLLLGNNGFAQKNLSINGQVVNGKNQDAIAFAKVYNKSTSQGTLTDANGKFSIPVKSLNDTLIISFIGFETKKVSKLSTVDVKISLNESVQIISEVYASAKGNDYLYEILLESKKHLPKKETKTKAYFELKTFIDSQQVELLEAYYNLQLNDYNIQEMNLKEGRFALKELMHTNFISSESSRAIVLLKLYAKNEYYPYSPTEFNKKQLHRNYRITLDKRYLDLDKNTIYVLNYYPRDSSSNYFNGQIWIDSNHHRLLKITENVEDAKRHPFIPFWSGYNKLDKVNFSINKTFIIRNNQVQLEHVDFDYSMRYFSLADDSTEVRLGIPANYYVSTKAVLMGYDSTLFELPKFNFPKEYISDYRKINAIPYNSFFWKNNTENKIQRPTSENDFLFINGSKLSHNTSRIFASNDFNLAANKDSLKPAYLSRYISWTGKRILFREELDKIEELKKSTILNSEKYKLTVQLYMDMNRYNDSTNILTKTIMDPYESFYYLPMDRTTHCFINIYFDLMELQRRKLQVILENALKHSQDLSKTYDEFMKELAVYSATVLRELERGTNFQALQIQNNIIKEALGIDNISLFEIVEVEED